MKQFKTSVSSSGKPAKSANRKRLVVRYDRTRRKFYVRIPKKLRPMFKNFKPEFHLSEEAQTYADVENLRLEADITVADLNSVMALWENLREKFNIKKTLYQFLSDYRDKQMAAIKEKTLAMIRDRFLADLKDKKSLKAKSAKRKDNTYISRLKNLLLPWPDLRLSELDDWEKAQVKIEELREFIEKQVDFYSGLRWNTCTKRNYLIHLCAIINHGMAQKLTPLKANPFEGPIDYKPEFTPEIYNYDDVQCFLTYLWHWEPVLYVAFVLATWAGLRTAEIKRLTYGMLSEEKLKNGAIVISRDITKKDRRRTILKADVPYVFNLLELLPPGWQQGRDTDLIFGVYNIDIRLTAAWRNLMGRPRPFNGSRHMAASNLLVFTNPEKPDRPIVETCKRVLGHKFVKLPEV